MSAAERRGSSSRLETPSLIFRFRHHDAASVVAAADQAEAIYTVLRSDFGLAGPPNGQKLEVDIRVTDQQSDSPTRLVALSRSRHQTPGALTDAEWLVQAIALSLLDHASRQTRDEHGIRPSWTPLLDGLRLWELWHIKLPLAIWQEEVIAWVYFDQDKARLRHSYLLADRHAHLCAAHRLWLPSPLTIGIPFLCAETTAQGELLAPFVLRPLPTQLNQFVLPAEPAAYVETSSRTERTAHPGQTVALATLIDYAVASYGRARLPTLVAGLGQHTTWDALIPAVYGVSTSEFERGWQAFLKEH